MYCEIILGQIPLNPATMSMYEPQLCDSDTALTHSLQSILTSTGSTTSSSVTGSRGSIPLILMEI